MRFARMLRVTLFSHERISIVVWMILPPRSGLAKRHGLGLTRDLF